MRLEASGLKPFQRELEGAKHTIDSDSSFGMLNSAGACSAISYVFSSQ